MADEIIFYTNPRSRGNIIRWLLEEIGVSYETKILEYGTSMKSPEYLKINPMGKVPTIIHNGNIITECAAICVYLADAFPQAKLAPAIGSPLRASYLRWMFFAAGPFEAAVINNYLGVSIADDNKAMVGYGNFDDVLNAIDGALEDGKYFLGDEFTALDVYIGSQINFGLQFNTIPACKSFENYAKLLMNRENWKKAQAIDTQLLA